MQGPSTSAASSEVPRRADALVVAAWGSVAEAYAASWGPRFQPFVEEALDAFAPGPGAIWVPGCGPGDEARALRERWPERALIATDPAPEMLALARERLQDLSLRIEQGAAGSPPLPALSASSAPDPGQAAAAPQLGGIFSSFVLQLLPERQQTLRAWAEALAPSGRAAVVFWPRQAENDAWGHLGRAMAEAGRERPDWETALREDLPRLGLRLTGVRDLQHEIHYPSPEAAWDLLCEACSLQVFLLRAGAEAARRARDAWLSDHGLVERACGPGAASTWVHRPVARLWLLAPEPLQAPRDLRDLER